MDGVLRNNLLEHITREDPRITVSDSCDRCRALVIVKQRDLAKADHIFVIAVLWVLIGTLLRSFRLENLFKGYLLIEIWVIRVGTFLINGDSYLAFGQHKVVSAHIPIADDDSISLKLL